MSTFSGFVLMDILPQRRFVLGQSARNCLTYKAKYRPIGLHALHIRNTEFTGMNTSEGMPQRQPVSIALRQTVGNFIVIAFVSDKDMLFKRHCCGAGDGTESKAGGVLIMGLPK